jgi:hypothetical protein
MNQDDKEREKKQREERERMERAENYAFCPIHSRRYPKGGTCPGCAASEKQK